MRFQDMGGVRETLALCHSPSIDNKNGMRLDLFK